jgi:hypothetical protein
LFALFLLLLVTDPAVENSFHLRCKSNLLFLDKRVCLQLSGLLLEERITSGHWTRV